MANVKISNLPAATSPVASTDVIPVVQGGVTKKAAINQLGFLQAGTGAVTRTAQAKMRESVSVADFGAVGDGVADDTAAIQAAVDYATTNGKSLYVPAGKYLISSSLKIIRPTGEYRADSFRMFGDGGGSVFLSKDLSPSTTIFANTDIPILEFDERISGGFNNLYIEYMRLEQTNSTAAQPVILLEITAGYSRFAYLEIRHAGTGDGFKILKGYLTTIEFTNIVNRDLVNLGSGVARVGTGVNLVSSQAGGLFTARKVTCRGFLNGYIIGNNSTALYSTKLDQCESSVVTDGITIQTNIVKSVIDACYFEAVYNKCVIDKGTATTVSNCMMFQGYVVGIDSTYTTFANVYRDNNIYVDGTNSIGIDVYADGDANGRQKLISGNYIYFLSSGGSVAGVNGVKLTGSNPSISVIDNTFRPRRQWVGGAGTVKFNNASTGKITGAVPITDTLYEFPLYSNAMLSFAQGNTLADASVSAGVMTLGAGSSFDVTFASPANITSLTLAGTHEPLLLFRLTGTNATFVDGAGQLRMAGNFSGPGMIMFRTQWIAGSLYAYEISRSTH